MIRSRIQSAHCSRRDETAADLHNELRSHHRTCVELKRVACHAVTNLDDIVAAPVDTSTQVVKLHGTFDDDGSLVLTETSYFDRLEFESPIDIKMRADILGKTLLFIGYSLSDINIRYMLYKLYR